MHCNVVCFFFSFFFFLQIIYTHVRSLCVYAGESNCEKMDVVIGSEGDEHRIIPENHHHCLEVGVEKAPSPACRMMKNNNK